MLAVDEATHRDLSGLEEAHVNLVRDQIRQHIAQARAHERQAAALWKRTLELLGESAGLEIPPDADLRDLEGGGLRLQWGERDEEEEADARE